MLLFTGFGLPDTMQNRAESSFSAESMDYDFRADVVSVPQMATPIEGLGSKSQAIMQMPVMTGPSDGYDRVITVLDENDRFHLRTRINYDGMIIDVCISCHRATENNIEHILCNQGALS